jgi:hypothetical protein
MILSSVVGSYQHFGGNFFFIITSTSRLKPVHSFDVLHGLARSRRLVDLHFRKFLVSFVSRVAQYNVWLRLDVREIKVRPWQTQKNFSSSLCVQTGCGAHPAFCTMGTGGTCSGAKARPGRDAEHFLLI